MLRRINDLDLYVDLYICCTCAVRVLLKTVEVFVRFFAHLYTQSDAK